MSTIIPARKYIIVRPKPIISKTNCQARTSTLVNGLCLAILTLIDCHENNNFSGNFIKNSTILNIKTMSLNDRNLIPDFIQTIFTRNQKCLD